jgi:hypothetical protein
MLRRWGYKALGGFEIEKHMLASLLVNQPANSKQAIPASLTSKLPSSPANKLTSQQLQQASLALIPARFFY